MSVCWSDLTFTPDAKAVSQLRQAWQWRLRQPFKPVMCSVLGDAFIELSRGGIYWLNTGTAELILVAEDALRYVQLLRTPLAEEWFLPELVDALQHTLPALQPNECYSYLTLPVVELGGFYPDNFQIMNAGAHFVLTGNLHRHLTLCQQKRYPPSVVAQLRQQVLEGQFADS